MNAAAFVGLKAWRGELVREQRAYCLVEAARGELRVELHERVNALIESFDEWRSFFGGAEDGGQVDRP